MNLWNETKSIPISRQEVWQAYKKVRSKKGSAGVDAVSMEEYDANCSKHLYKLWNRMASGSYFPPPVKEVEILKKDGKVRRLGIPTISDRVGQMVIKYMLEPRLEKIFSNNSYGYRPHKNAHQALEKVRKNCWKTDWVIDLDIKGVFDNIDHEKLMLAVNKHVPENWIRFYIERWLKAPKLTKSGKLINNQGKGTPQGGVISPLLANLFLHYALDKWLEQTDKTLKYVRYADDVIIHCVSKAHAEHLLKSIHERMQSVGLELHPQKTKIVYCKDYRRTEKYPIIKFEFLGYSFQPRTTKSKTTRSIICDLQRSKFIFISEGLYEILTTHKNKEVSYIKNYYKQEINKIIDKYFTFLLDNEYGFWCDSEDIDNFPEINFKFESPELINNAIIDVDIDIIVNYNKIFNELDLLRCKFIEIRSFKVININELLSRILIFTKNKIFRNITIYLNYYSNIIQEITESNILSEYSCISEIIVHSSPINEISNKKIVLTKSILKSENDCGKICIENFSINITTFSEAGKFNTCLNKKISIDSTGNIKNCPSLNNSFGNIKNSSLIEIANSKKFQFLWRINKSEINSCKDCEFRYICTDCRAYVQNTYDKPVKCKYDPYEGKWK